MFENTCIVSYTTAVFVYVFALFGSEFYILENNSILKEAVLKKMKFQTETKTLHIDDYGKYI